MKLISVSVVHYDYKSAVFGCMNFLTHLDMITMYFVLFLNVRFFFLHFF